MNDCDPLPQYNDAQWLVSVVRNQVMTPDGYTYVRVSRGERVGILMLKMNRHGISYRFEDDGTLVIWSGVDTAQYSVQDLERLLRVQNAPGVRKWGTGWSATFAEGGVEVQYAGVSAAVRPAQLLEGARLCFTTEGLAVYTDMRVEVIGWQKLQKAINEVPRRRDGEPGRA